MTSSTHPPLTAEENEAFCEALSAVVSGNGTGFTTGGVKVEPGAQWRKMTESEPAIGQRVIVAWGDEDFEACNWSPIAFQDTGMPAFWLPFPAPPEMTLPERVR